MEEGWFWAKVRHDLQVDTLREGPYSAREYAVMDACEKLSQQPSLFPGMQQQFFTGRLVEIKLPSVLHYLADSVHVYVEEVLDNDGSEYGDIPPSWAGYMLSGFSEETIKSADKVFWELFWGWMNTKNRGPIRNVVVDIKAHHA